MEGEQPGAALPPDVAVLAELLLERLDAATGTWRIELFATDGRVRKFARQEEGGRDRLAQFNDGSPQVHAATAAPPEGETAADSGEGTG